MAGAIRLTAKEREYLRFKLCAKEFDPKLDRPRVSFLAKLDKAEAPKGNYLDVKIAVEAFRGVLGDRLILPMGAVWGMMQNRIRALGLTRDQCIDIATAAAGDWQGKVKAESLVRQAERLLDAAHSGSPKSTPRGKRGALDMEDL